MKEGIRTTEFWLSLGVIVCATILRALGEIDTAAWTTVAAGGSGVYAIARTVTKRVAATPIEPVAIPVDDAGEDLDEEN